MSVTISAVTVLCDQMTRLQVLTAFAAKSTCDSVRFSIELVICVAGPQALRLMLVSFFSFENSFFVSVSAADRYFAVVKFKVAFILLLF